MREYIALTQNGTDSWGLPSYYTYYSIVPTFRKKYISGLPNIFFSFSEENLNFRIQRIFREYDFGGPKIHNNFVYNRKLRTFHTSFFYYKITFVNSHQENTNSKGYLKVYSKTILNFVLKISGIK